MAAKRRFVVVVVVVVVVVTVVCYCFCFLWMFFLRNLGVVRLTQAASCLQGRSTVYNTRVQGLILVFCFYFDPVTWSIIVHEKTFLFRDFEMGFCYDYHLSL